MAPRAKQKVPESPAEVMALINKRYPGAMKRASDPSLEIVRIPSGILTVDCMIGGGFARNRVTEVFGSANVGKGYLAQKLIASVQDLGGVGAWIDAEKTYDPVFGEHCGIDNEAMVYHEQIHGPMCVNVMETLLRSEQFDVIVCDSIAALLPLYEFENESGAASMGMEQAKLMSQALRRLTAANRRTILFFINQTRENIGVTFGKKSTTSGGRAMSFYAGLRLELTRVETLKKKGRKVNEKTGEIKDDADVPYGHRVLVRGEKDKTGGLARPLDETTFVFDYEKGKHDQVEDLIYLGRLTGQIEKSGDKWWVAGYEDEKKHGRPAFKKWLKKQRAVREELEEIFLSGSSADAEEED